MKKAVAILLAVLVLLQLSVGALAMDYVPSIEQHDEPEIKVIVGPDGVAYVALIVTNDRQFLKGVPQGKFILTTVGSKSPLTQNIKLALTDAFSEIQKAFDLEDLTPGISGEISKQDPEASQGNFKMRDFFDVRVIDDYADLLSVEGNLLQFTLDFGLEPEQIVAVCTKLDGTDWNAMGLDVDFRNNHDGSITFWLDACGIIALSVDDEEIGGGEAGDAPRTLDRVASWAVTGVCLIAAGCTLLIVYLVKTRRRT